MTIFKKENQEKNAVIFRGWYKLATKWNYLFIYLGLYRRTNQKPQMVKNFTLQKKGG